MGKMYQKSVGKREIRGGTCYSYPENCGLWGVEKQRV